MCVGNRIKEYMHEIGMSQTYLSSKSGIALPKLNLVLNGNRRLTFEEYETLCGVLGVGTDRFLTPRIPQCN